MSLDTAMEQTFSVGDFCRLIGDVLGHTFPHDVWVQGEVRGIKRAQSGHVYFDLVDAAPEPGRSPDALLPVVLFESTRRTVNKQIKRSGGGMRIDDGVSVRIRAQPDFYAPQGRLSLRMTGIDPAYTLGQLAASRERLLRTLAEENLIDANSRVPMPTLPLRVGLVTASGSAAEADFVEELRRSAVSFSVVVASTPVQGPGAAHRIAASIRACVGHGVDVVAVVRGGGAKTDLVAFDDEVVARTIAACRVPVLTGIGHEIDTAVADHVAHRSLKTPTACAAHLVEAALVAERRAAETWTAITTLATERLDRDDRRLIEAAASSGRRAAAILQQADDRTVALAHRTRSLVSSTLDRADDRLQAHVSTAALQARYRLRTAAGESDRAIERLARSSRAHLAAATARIGGAEERARLLDPARALARGWSITMDDDGRVIRSTDDVAVGTRITTRIADGHIVSTTQSTTRSDRP